MHPAETVRLKREVDSNANKVNEKCCCVILWEYFFCFLMTACWHFLYNVSCL
jgi:hypothetical protein